MFTEKQKPKPNSQIFTFCRLSFLVASLSHRQKQNNFLKHSHCLHLFHTALAAQFSYPPIILCLLISRCHLYFKHHEMLFSGESDLIILITNR